MDMESLSALFLSFYMPKFFYIQHVQTDIIPINYIDEPPSSWSEMLLNQNTGTKHFSGMITKSLFL